VTDTPDPQDVNTELVMPFVVCQSEGGPYDDVSFVAGYTAGLLDADLRSAAWARVERGFPIPTPLVPQADLIAMRHGYALEATPWDDAPEEWTFVTFVASTAEDAQ
jgi:hypothetical protein